ARRHRSHIAPRRRHHVVRSGPSDLVADHRLTSNPCDTTKIVCPRSLCCSRYVIRFRKGSRAGLDDLSEVIVNSAELIDQIRDRLGVDKRAAENAVDVVLDTIQRAVAAGEKVAITGFGVFEKVERAARTGRNPRTGAEVKIKKTSVPKFRHGKQFKGVVSGAVMLCMFADSVTKSADKR